jgi:hypothetical protein
MCIPEVLLDEAAVCAYIGPSGQLTAAGAGGFIPPLCWCITIVGSIPDWATNPGGQHIALALNLGFNWCAVLMLFKLL